ncbi:hypothetical protein TcG_10541, partial [Trypanosoma cruzi]
MVGAFVVVVVVVVFGFISISALLSTCPTMIESGERNEPGSSSETSSVVSAGAAGPGLVGVLDDTAVTVPLFTFSLGVMSVSVSVCPTISVTHTDGQQHRVSTNRAHSRRHVVIIVSVVVQWCGADLHSEGHGEQQGRREVRQTHTEGKLHEERAAARHAPYAAHHARHTLQSTVAGAHRHTALPQHQHTDGGGRSKQERHTRLHRMHIRRERSVVSAPLTEGTHTQEEAQRTQQHKS